MKTLLFIILLSLSFSAHSEIYSCKYKEFETTKNISFDRVGHSHFKKCSDNICDKVTYTVLYVDNDNLIIGDIIKNKDSRGAFQIFIIDKIDNLFSSARISLPGLFDKNLFVSGKWVVY